MNEKNITPEGIHDEECERLGALDSNARVILEGFWELEEYADTGNQAMKQEEIYKAYEVAALFEIALALRELRDRFGSKEEDAPEPEREDEPRKRWQ